MSALVWQAAEGSHTLHVIDAERPAPVKSGPKALCGRRPQRNRDWWFSLPIQQLDPRKRAPYMLSVCLDCLDEIESS